MLEATIIAIGIQLTCLTQNIYFEARDQPTVGQMAVGSVVLNRVPNYNLWSSQTRPNLFMEERFPR